MKKIIIILVFLISILSVNAQDIPCLEGAGPLLLGQQYCSETADTNSIFNFLAQKHYRMDYITTFTHYFDIEENEEDPLDIYIDFGFDVNNPSPTRDSYEIVEEYDYYNFIRPSSSKTVIEDNYNRRESTNDYAGINRDNYDFVGPPIYLTSCFLDCNVNDNTPAVSFDLRGVPSYWYQNIGNTYDVNTGGLVPYSWIQDRFNINRVTQIPRSLRFENNYYQCSYDTTGVKSVAMGCTLEADTWQRHPNIDTTYEFWDLNDIITGPFPSASNGKTSWTYQKRIEVDIDNDNYSVTVSTQAPDGGGYIPPGGEGILEQTESDVNIEEQRSVFLLKEQSELENAWQNSMLNIIDIIFIILMILFYLFSSFVLMFIFFGSLPYIMRRFLDNLDKLTSLKKKVIK